jgi:hypothetical protein
MPTSTNALSALLYPSGVTSGAAWKATFRFLEDPLGEQAPVLSRWSIGADLLQLGEQPVVLLSVLLEAPEKTRRLHLREVFVADHGSGARHYLWELVARGTATVDEEEAATVAVRRMVDG